VSPGQAERAGVGLLVTAIRPAAGQRHFPR
jgi:hypothetical protein